MLVALLAAAALMASRRHLHAGPVLLAIGALGLGACGSRSPAPSSTTAPTSVRPPSTATGSSPSPVPIPPANGLPKAAGSAGASVIRGWADALRHGHIAAASRYFALPTLVANGTGPIELRTRADVRFFNETLPCGAVLIQTGPGAHGTIIATFRLTERPGPGTCGSGVGQTARTAFRIRGGLIVGWVRVADAAPAPGTPA
jgi:hypothetical protein